MYTVEQIAAMDAFQLTRDFSTVMGDIVEFYGDDQEVVPCACPGSESMGVLLPGSDHASVLVSSSLVSL